MKRIYMLFIAASIAFSATAEGPVLIDEDITDWSHEETGNLPLATFQGWAEDVRTAGGPILDLGNAYINWPAYATPAGIDLEVLAGRYRPHATDATIDLLVNNYELEDGTAFPGAVIFTVPSISKIEIRSRSGSNTALTEPDRALYVAEELFGEFEQVSQDFTLHWGSYEPESFSWAAPKEEETKIAIMCKEVGEDPGENLRLRSFKVWGAVTNSINANSKANVSIYSVPGNIRIGGDVVKVEVINLAGSTVMTSNTAGFQSIATSSLANGIYLIKATDSNGLERVEKVVVR